MTYNNEHLFTCLLAICIFYLVRSLFRSFALIKIRLFIFFLLSFLFWVVCVFVCCVCVCVYFLWLHLQHIEVPRLGVELELQLPAYATATAMTDRNHLCDLRPSLQQHWILNPLSKARDQTQVLMDTSWVLNPQRHNGNS